MIEYSIVQKIVIWALPLLFAITVHEVAHGWVASKLGDPTARLLGRLTLNPIKHIDLVGTILVPLLLLVVSAFVFGWAKPVPIDPRNFKNSRRDTALVALAGPMANFAMALVWGSIAKGGLYLLATHNVWLGDPLLQMGKAGILINAMLGVLNLIPCPPLDGSKVLYSILPGRWVWRLQRVEPLGFLLLMFVWATGFLSYLLFPPVLFFIQWIAAIFGLNA
jgi:Zn-dependent protease